MEKTRVYNQRKYAVGLILQNGAERVVHPGSFILLSRDEIEYLASIAPALFDGEKQLRLEDRALAAQLGFVDDAQAETLDAEAIRKKLNQRAAAAQGLAGRRDRAVPAGRGLRRGGGDGSAGEQAAAFAGARAGAGIPSRGVR